MKICVVEFMGRGGLIHYAYQLCRALARDAEVTLATDRRYELEGLDHPFRLRRIFDLWDPKPDAPLDGAGGGIGAALLHRLRRIPRGIRYYRQWAVLARFLRRDPHDVVLLGDLRFAGDAAGVRLLRGLAPCRADICHNVRPLAGGGRAAGTFRRRRLEAWAYGAAYRELDHIFVHYDTNRRRFLAAYGVDPERVTAIPLGHQGLFRELAADDDGPAGRSRTVTRPVSDEASSVNADDDGPIVLFFGTLTRYKGIDVLLSAFSRVRRDHPDARLAVVGFPTPDIDVSSLERQIADLGIEDAVDLVPRYVDSRAVHRWMEAASVAVFPYRDVSQSAALQVAQTFGVPVIASRVGAIPEIVQHGTTGLLVPPDDVGALAAAVDRLLSDGDVRRGMGVASRRETARRSSWRRVAAAVLEGCRGELNRR